MREDLTQVKKQTNEALSSLEVANMVEKEHKYLMRDIRHYSDVLHGAKISLVDFWVDSHYVDENNRQRPCYQITKKGCEFIANKTPGDKGVLFTARYINRFHEMSDTLKNPAIKDSRLDLARIISRTPARNLPTIRALYPEYFGALIDRDSLAHTVDVNTSYSKWIEDYGITREWIGDFPTADIYNSYVRYCHDNRFSSMGRNEFYKTLENDFNMSRKQKHDGFRYFVTI